MAETENKFVKKVLIPLSPILNQQLNLLPWRPHYLVQQRQWLLGLLGLLFILTLVFIFLLWCLYKHHQLGLYNASKALLVHAQVAQQGFLDMAQQQAKVRYQEATSMAQQRARHESDMPMTTVLWAQQMASELNAQVEKIHLDHQGLVIQLSVVNPEDNLLTSSWLPPNGRLLSVKKNSDRQGRQVWLINVGVVL
jgi:Tfp pilus assembly protein PilN